MSVRHTAIRSVSILLILNLICPSPTFAMRTLAPEPGSTVRSGLEEILRSDRQPPIVNRPAPLAAGAEELSSSQVIDFLRGANPNWLFSLHERHFNGQDKWIMALGLHGPRAQDPASAFGNYIVSRDLAGMPRQGSSSHSRFLVLAPQPNDIWGSIVILPDPLPVGENYLMNSPARSFRPGKISPKIPAGTGDVLLVRIGQKSIPPEFSTDRVYLVRVMEDGRLAARGGSGVPNTQTDGFFEFRPDGRYMVSVPSSWETATRFGREISLPMSYGNIALSWSDGELLVKHPAEGEFHLGINKLQKLPAAGAEETAYSIDEAKRVVEGTVAAYPGLHITWRDPYDRLMRGGKVEWHGIIQGPRDAEKGGRIAFAMLRSYDPGFDEVPAGFSWSIALTDWKDEASLEPVDVVDDHRLLVIRPEEVIPLVERVFHFDQVQAMFRRHASSTHAAGAEEEWAMRPSHTLYSPTSSMEGKDSGLVIHGFNSSGDEIRVHLEEMFDSKATVRLQVFDRQGHIAPGHVVILGEYGLEPLFQVVVPPQTFRRIEPGLRGGGGKIHISLRNPDVLEVLRDSNVIRELADAQGGLAAEKKSGQVVEEFDGPGHLVLVNLSGQGAERSPIVELEISPKGQEGQKGIRISSFAPPSVKIDLESAYRRPAAGAEEIAEALEGFVRAWKNYAHASVRYQNRDVDEGEYVGRSLRLTDADLSQARAFLREVLHREFTGEGAKAKALEWLQRQEVWKKLKAKQKDWPAMDAIYAGDMLADPEKMFKSSAGLEENLKSLKQDSTQEQRDGVADSIAQFLASAEEQRDLPFLSSVQRDVRERGLKLFLRANPWLEERLSSHGSLKASWQDQMKILLGVPGGSTDVHRMARHLVDVHMNLNRKEIRRLIHWHLNLNTRNPLFETNLFQGLISAAEGKLPAEVKRAFTASEDDYLMLGGLEESSVSKWIPYLSSSSSMERAGAAWELEKLGQKAASAVPALGKALKDEYPEVRFAVVMALWNMEVAASPAVSALAGALGDKNAAICFFAALALGNIGPAAAEAVSQLRLVLQDRKDDDVRSAAARALGRIGPAASAAAPDLQRALNEEYLFVRSAARDALRKINPNAEFTAGMEERRVGVTERIDWSGFPGLSEKAKQVGGLLEERFYGSSERFLDAGRGVRQAAQAAEPLVAIFLPDHNIPGGNEWERVSTLAEIEGGFRQAMGWKGELSFTIELASSQVRQNQLLAKGYRVIQVVIPEKQDQGVLSKEGLFMLVTNAYQAASQQLFIPGRPARLTIEDAAPYYRVQSASFPDFVAGAEELWRSM